MCRYRRGVERSDLMWAICPHQHGGSNEEPEQGRGSRVASKAGLNANARRKVIVFSTYADTVDDVEARVKTAVNAADPEDPLADYQGRLAPAAVKGAKSGIDQKARARLLSQFAPETAGELNNDGSPQEEDKYDLLFTTDVLSEGVNLQQAGRIINYDLPWNPMRLVQRHGRIDRIGSKHTTVILGCFFPSEHLDTLLHLEETLQRKLTYANAAIGATKVLPGFKSRFEVNLRDTRKQIEDLRAENPELFENRGSSSAAVSGEEYRRRLAQAIADPFVKQDVEALPWMSGSDFVNNHTSTSGYVFCLRMGNHPKAWFRFVPTRPGTWTPTYDQPVGEDDGRGSHWQAVADDAATARENPSLGEPGRIIVVDDTLTCLMAADPSGPDTARDLPDDAYEGAFAAWEAARDQALEDWLHLTDPTNLMPEAPKALRDAADLVYAYGSDALSSQDEQDLITRLNSSPSVRVQRDVRAALNTDKPPGDRIRDIRQVLMDAGVIPTEPADPLPHLEPTDVHLIAWMAVQGKDAALSEDS
jgi:hypothetical protein